MKFLSDETMAVRQPVEKKSPIQLFEQDYTQEQHKTEELKINFGIPPLLNEDKF